MTDINQIKRSFAELQEMYNAGDSAGLRQYLCEVTGRQYCRVCGGFHEATWSKHPVAMLREAVETYRVGGR